MSGATPAEIGAEGEQIAAERYLELGLRILARNWRCDRGEIDLILADDLNREIVFSEVKTRSSNHFGWPFEAVGHSKQVRLRRTAAQWIAASGHSGHVGYALRFDVVSVINPNSCRPSVEMIVRAF